MYRQLTDQAEKYLRSLYNQDDIAGELKRKLADLMACGEFCLPGTKAQPSHPATPPQGRENQFPESSAGSPGCAGS